VRYRAIFFDAGETLVHPQPSFAELFARVVAEEGHSVVPDEVLNASRAVLDRFSEAAGDRELWTTSPERSRRFWLSVYDRMIAELGLSDADGLAERLHAAFTDRSNYALFDDVLPALEGLSGNGTIIGLVSNFEDWLEDLLVDLGVRDEFSVRVVSGVEGVENPTRASTSLLWNAPASPRQNRCSSVTIRSLMSSLRRSSGCSPY
jgi:FMN phosphatase YigB (HAD superfamily)